MSKRKLPDQCRDTPASSYQEHAHAEPASITGDSSLTKLTTVPTSVPSDERPSAKRKKLETLEEAPVVTNERNSDQARESERQERSYIGSARDEPLDERVNLPLNECAVAEQESPIPHWVHNDYQWSTILGRAGTMSERRSASKRALSSTNSFGKTTQSGDTPKTWGRGQADIMLHTGLYMEKQSNATIAQDDEKLCSAILQAQYEPPQEWRYQRDNIGALLKLALYRNEAKIRREIGHLIMPSPEAHHAQGHPGIEHIAEGVDARWTKCTSLCGPMSQPDVCHGVSRFVFTSEEREKLFASDTCACETMMFPFYICEARCFDSSIAESELKALHAASVACRTIIDLYKKISAADELDRRILAFSVSHNQRLVKIFGHFALIDGDSVSYHRHVMFEADLLSEASQRTRPYQIALGIWEHFFPRHLERIQDALARQHARAVESFTAQLGLNEESNEINASPSTQEEDQTGSLLTLLANLGDEKASLLKLMSERKEEASRQRELLERQLKQQKEEFHQQMERQVTQHEEQMRQQKMILDLLQSKGT